ncbi:unnamed protein product [Boreogadus saida]
MACSDTKWHDPSSYFSGPRSEPEIHFILPTDTKWHDPSSYFSGPTSEPEIHFILPTGKQVLWNCPLPPVSYCRADLH